MCQTIIGQRCHLCRRISIKEANLEMYSLHVKFRWIPCSDCTSEVKRWQGHYLYWQTGPKKTSTRVGNHAHLIPTKFHKQSPMKRITHHRWVSKSTKRRKICRNLDFGMEPKLTPLLHRCFAFCLSLWPLGHVGEACQNRGHSTNYFCPLSIHHWPILPIQ